jgi:hypothetical protein
MNHRISPLTPSATGCFLSRLINDKLGPDFCSNIEIINDNALSVVRKTPVVQEHNTSNERENKAQRHIASRWGDSKEVNRHDRHDDAQLRPISRRSSEQEIEEVSKEVVSSSHTNAKWSTSFATGTVRCLDGLQKEEGGGKDSHERCTSPWNYSTARLSELLFSEYDVDTIPGNDMNCKYNTVFHLTTEAVSISSSSPRLPRRRKSFTRSVSPVNVSTPIFIRQASASI